jgi:hypothetical protein
MTNPFQSLFAPQGPQVEGDELKLLKHAPDCTGTDQFAQSILFPKVVPFPASPLILPL